MASWLKIIGNNPTKYAPDPAWGTNTIVPFPKNNTINQIKKDDTIITYAHTLQRIITAYKVLSEKIHFTQTEKNIIPWREEFPYYLIGENITPDYGLKWTFLNLTYPKLEEAYPKEILPNGESRPISRMMNAGRSHIEITKGFSNYIINEMNKAAKKSNLKTA